MTIILLLFKCYCTQKVEKPAIRFELAYFSEWFRLCTVEWINNEGGCIQLSNERKPGAESPQTENLSSFSFVEIS